MVGIIEIPTTSCEENRGRRSRADQRGSKSRDRWSRRISGRRGTSIIHTGSRDPLRYINGANTYQFVGSDPVGMVDASGEAAAAPIGLLNIVDDQAAAWLQEGHYLSALALTQFAGGNFAKSGNAGLFFEPFAAEIIGDARYEKAANAHFRNLAASYGRPGFHPIYPIVPPAQNAFKVNFKPGAGIPRYFDANKIAEGAKFGLNEVFGTSLPRLSASLGIGHFGYLGGVLVITGCPGRLKWQVEVLMIERNLYHYEANWLYNEESVYHAAYLLQKNFGRNPFYEQIIWPQYFHGSLKLKAHEYGGRIVEANFGRKFPSTQ